MISKEIIFIKNCIEKYCGISIGENNLFMIENRVSEVMKSHKIRHLEQICQLLSEKRDDLLVDKIISAITINETFWFRDTGTYEILEHILLPKYINLLKNRQIDKVYIWSSACSSGQEPYSIAIFIDNYLERNSHHNISLDMFEIIASDICSEMLQKSISGIYDNISMERGIKEDIVNLYFTKKNKSWSINDKIRNAVNFQKINLKNFILRNKFDIIFCKYVLIYFSEQSKKEILRHILSYLNKDGVLFIGSSELIDNDHFNLYKNVFKNGIYYTSQPNLKG